MPSNNLEKLQTVAVNTGATRSVRLQNLQFKDKGTRDKGTWHQRQIQSYYNLMVIG